MKKYTVFKVDMIKYARKEEIKMGKYRKNISKNKIVKQILGIAIIIAYVIINYFTNNEAWNNNNTQKNSEQIYTYFDISSIPEYTDKIYITINNNVPYFDEKEYTTQAFEKYSELDALGRCGIAYANICKEIMPTNKRGDISEVYPTGWVQVKYNGEYLYNRCHLIGYQLAGEDANKLNLITGTRYFNVSGMLPFENEVAEYIKENSNNHVLYRVTPIFKEDNLVASGVEIEAYSVEDNGQGVCFNVYIYNVEPGITIDYKTGISQKNK